MEYSEPISIINKPASRLYAAIKKVAKIDQGTGSTFQALANRGMIQVSERGPDRYTHIRITPAGRKLVRSWTGQKAYKALPVGTLREWHWRALAAAYAAGEQGLPDSGGGYGTHRLAYLAAPRGVRRWPWAPRRDGVDPGTQRLATCKTLGRQCLSQHIRVRVRGGEH
jgi:hypothetical protein